MCVYEVFKLNRCLFMKYLKEEEKAKHELWFNAKRINVKEFVDEVNTWTQSTKAV